MASSIRRRPRPRRNCASAWHSVLCRSSLESLTTRNFVSSAPATGTRACAGGSFGTDGAIRIVPDAELQHKGDRSYFETGSRSRPTTSIFRRSISTRKMAFSKRRSFQRCGRPLQYTHLTASLSASSSSIPTCAGVRANSIGNENGTELYVVNERGDYLLNPAPGREFGFEFGKPVRIQDDFPGFADLLAKNDTTPLLMTDRTGARFGVGWESVRLAGGPRVSVIETVPYSQVIGAATAIRNSSLVGGLAAVVCALLLAVALARSLTRPLVQMTKAVEGFSDDAPIVMPAGGGREINVLAVAFGHMAAEYKQRRRPLSRRSRNAASFSIPRLT